MRSFTKLDRRKLAEHLASTKQEAERETDPYMQQWDRNNIAELEQELARRHQMTKIAELLYLGHAEVLSADKRIRVSYRGDSPYHRKDHAKVTLYGEDGFEESMVNMPISSVEQYIRDHGGDPDGKWIDTIFRKEIFTV